MRRYISILKSALGRRHNHKIFDRQFVIDIALLCAAVLTLFFWVPVYHVGVTPGEFGFLDGPIFLRLSLLWSFIFIAPLCLVFVFLHGIGMKSGARFLAVFLLTWTVLAGLAFPLVRSDGMIEASEAQINGLHLMWVVVFSLCCSTLASTQRLVFPLVFCLILTATTAIPSLPAFFRSFAKAESPLDFFKVSTEKNIFVVSFDGLPGVVADQVLSEYPKLAEAFKDFVVFTNAVSQAPATHASMRAELFGSRSYHELGATDAQVDAILHLDSLLLNSVENSYTYGTYNDFNVHMDKQVPALSFVRVPEHDKIDRHMAWMELLLARIGTPHLPGMLRDTQLSDRIMLWMSPSKTQAEGLAMRLKNYTGPAWKQSYVLQTLDYDWIVNHLTASKPGLAVRHMHFLHVHFPVDFDETGAFRSDNSEWHRANQNEEGLFNQCIGSLNQFAFLIRKLRELEIYDRSLIVLKSDHGKPAPYYDSPPHDMRINNNKLWGFNRYMPLLMIKDFGRRANQLARDPRLVALPDLAKTLCVAAQTGNMDCSKYSGLDLLDTEAVADDSVLYLEVVKNVDSTFRFDTHQTIALTRSRRGFYDILKASELVDLDSPSTRVE